MSLTRESTFTGLFLGDTTSANSGNQFIIRNTTGTTGAGRLTVIKYISGVSAGLYATLVDNIKVAIKWNGSTADVFVNGSKVVSATPFATTAMENLICNAPNVPNYIKQMKLYNTPLSDSECSEITSI